jgi:hypothetical protein
MNIIKDEPLSGWTICDDGRLRDAEAAADYYALAEMKTLWREERRMKRGTAKLLVFVAFVLMALAVSAGGL